MKHADCGGELKRTHGNGRYRCLTCKGVVTVGVKMGEFKEGLTPTRFDLTFYDREAGGYLAR